MQVFFLLLAIFSWLVCAFGGENCTAGKFPYNSLCYDCDVACAACTQAGQCSNCSTSTGKPFAYNDYCYSTCPVATFQLNSTACQACPDYCASCTSDLSCSACQTGRYKYQGLCYDKCPDGSYGDSSFNCHPCLSPCTKCTNDTTCQSCASNFLLYDSQCLGICPPGAYKNGLVCEKCPVGCSECINATSCSACQTGFYKKDSRCYGICPTGTYGNSFNSQCESCGAGCGSCTASYPYCRGLSCGSGCTDCTENDQCTRCGVGLVKEGNVCTMDFNTLPADPVPTGDCIDGHIPDCATCSDLDSCALCSNGFYLSGSECTSSCPSGTYAGNSTCESCIPHCVDCGGWAQCSQCQSPYYLFKHSECLISCPVGYFPTTTNSKKVCQACPTNCSNCTNSSFCTSCQDGSFLSGTTCIKPCPAKTYPFEGVCTSCSDHCTTCSDGNKCTLCETGWNLVNNICSAQCPAGFYPTNGVCQVCPVGCATCTDAKTCLTCDSGYAFYQKTKTCPFKCPDGTYDAAGYCEDCATGCRLCENDEVCLQCFIEYVYFNQTCFSGCPDGYYNGGGICAVCPTGCATCTSAKLCQTCIYGYNVHFTDVCALDITESEKAEMRKMASTAQATETSSTVISSIYAFMNSGDPAAMFMGSLAKMLEYVKYINIEYPPKIKFLFGLRANVNESSETIVTKVHAKIEDTSKSPLLSNNFGYYKLTSSFVSNNLKSLVILAGIIAGIGVNYLILSKVSPSSKVHQICRSLMGILKWNLFLMMFCGMVGDMIFFSSFEFRNAKFENAFSVFSFVVCLAMNLLSIFVFYKLVQVNLNLQKSRNSRIAMKHEADFMKDAESKWESCKVFFQSYKNKKLSQQAFMVFFLIRVISFYLIIAYFSAYPFLQMIMIILVSLSIVIYLIIVRPFKSVLNNINQIVFELIILAFNGCVLILAALDTAKSNDYLTRKKLETALLNINLIASFVSTSFVVLKAIVALSDLYKDRRLKKAQSSRLKFKKRRPTRNILKANKNLPAAATTNANIFAASPNLSSQNILHLDTVTVTKMDQTYENQSFDINLLDQSRLRNHSQMISNTPSSLSTYGQGSYHGYQSYNQGMLMPESRSNSCRMMKQSSNSTSKRIKKRTTRSKNGNQQRLQDGQNWQNGGYPPFPHKERIRRIRDQYKMNGIDIISL